jgi:hypothetical protein
VAFNDSTTFDGDVVFYVAASGFTGGAAAIGITESAATTTLLFAGCEL